MIQRIQMFHRIGLGLSMFGLLTLAGCHKGHSGKKTTSSHASADSKSSHGSSKPEPITTVTVKPVNSEKSAAAEKKAEARAGSAKRMSFTADNNPTTKGGRGAPDLDNPQSPSAWVFLDGKAGKFKEEGGQKLLQWFIDDSVTASPKFRVEAFEPLLGTPKDFKAVLRTIEAIDGSDLVYGIAAKEGTFEIGREYSLLNPGENFVIRNGLTGDEVKEIAPLPSGKYAIAGAVVNSASGKQTLAVTYFTVKSDE